MQYIIELEIALGLKNKRYEAEPYTGAVKDSQCDVCGKYLDGDKVKRFLLRIPKKPRWFLCKKCGEKMHLVHDK